MSDPLAWQTMDTAPRDGTPFQAAIPGHGQDNVIAWINGFVGTAGEDVGGWCFVEHQEPPDDWDDGVCWAVNAYGNPSTQPTMWKRLPPEWSDRRASHGGHHD